MGKWKEAHGPTWVVAGATYSAWLFLTFEHRAVPGPLLALLGGWVIAWHGSLQHEMIHGHPARWPRLRTLVAWPPLSLWLPYELYRDSHLAHHRSHRLAEAGHDPESHHVEREHWESLSSWRRALLMAHQTLLGRLTLGPFFMIARFMRELLKTPQPSQGRLWLGHALAVGAIASWLILVCQMSLIKYLVCFVYPGLAMTLLRSFVEHRPRGDARARTVSVVSPALGILFLHNNLHIAHHLAPQLPWFELPAFFNAHRAMLQEAGSPVYQGGYWEVLKKYAFRRVSAPTGDLEGTL
jgi:fatty acid desaturase